MRVLFVSQEMPPDTAWGGIGTYVDVLSAALAARGTEVEVLSLVRGQRPSRRNHEGATVVRAPLRGPQWPERVAPDSWRRLILPAAVARHVQRLRPAPDVVEAPEWMAEGLVLALAGRLPLVVRLHSSVRQVFPHTGQGGALRGVDGWLAAELEELSARRANVVVSTAANLAEVGERMRLDPAALHAIPYPVRLPPLARRPPGPPRVVFVGRLEPRKGTDVLVRSIPAVRAAVPDVRFVFVGRDVLPPENLAASGWLRAEAERLGVGEAVEVTGQLDRHGVADQLRRASVCAFPSRWESFGNVVAEASATGRPVVVSDIAPFHELVGDGETGRIVPGGNPAAFATAIIELLSSPERAAAMGRAGAERVAGISDPARVARLAAAAHQHAIERWWAGRRAGR